MNVSSAIYGEDNREETTAYSFTNIIADSVAIRVANILIVKNVDGTLAVEDVETLGEELNSCREEKFINQPVLGSCSGFLIADNILITAGHCMLNVGTVVNETELGCEAFSWYFGFKSKNGKSSDYSKINPENIYKCKRIIRAERFEKINAGIFKEVDGNDFAVVELDRSVTVAKPLKRSKKRPKRGDLVYTVGHPIGIPSKFSGFSKILETKIPHYFSVNLDTSGGNSGGPVLNFKNEVIGVLVSGHQHDFYETERGCLKLNRCDLKEKKCNQNNSLQFSNFVQHIDTIKNYFP